MDAAGCMLAPGFIEMMTGRAAARLELATCQAPQRYAAGIRWVWVNGGVVLGAGPFQVRPTGPPAKNPLKTRIRLPCSEGSRYLQFP